MLSAAGLTTFGTDFSAQNVITLRSKSDLLTLYENGFFEKKEPFYLLGGGSNVVFTSDFPGTLLLNRIKGAKEEIIDEQTVRLTFGAGEIWDDCVVFSLRMADDLTRKTGSVWGSGMENLSIIPGTVGAAPIQNIGAYGIEQKSCFHSLRAFHISTGEFITLTSEKCRFGYRDSIFKHEYAKKYFITEVSYTLRPDYQPHLTYGSVREEALKLSGGQPPTPEQVRQAVIAIRTSKLPDPKQLGNSGSFFKNPIVTAKEFESVRNRIPERLVYFQADGTVKIAAGGLIDEAGLKGYRKGNLGTYPLQALVIVHYGGAAGTEIRDFINEIREKVRQKFGIDLEPEVNIV